ncbi:MAG: M28 family peptidase [Planctomycetes bacterium]|nr:M28 family peptidase [Planctomycetota bacterium]
MKARLFISGLTAIGAIFAFPGGNDPSPEIKKGQERILAEDAMKHVDTLASKEFEGRETGEPGCEKASLYLVKQFESLGLVPLGDEKDGKRSYLQEYPIGLSQFDAASGFIIKESDGKETVVPCGAQWRSLSVSSVPRDVTTEHEIIDAGIVNIERTGTDSESQPSSRKEYKLKLPDNAEGKFIVIRIKDATIAPLDLNRTVINAINNAKASGALFAPADDADENYKLKFERGANWSTFRVKMRTPDGDAGQYISRGNNPPVLLLPNGKTASEWIGKSAKFIMTPEVKPYHSANVVGLLRGSDPTVAETYVVHSAHYDHEGIKRGMIYYGADDNASGTTAVLEIARAYRNTKIPRRSVIFLLVSGEEKGLWGSAYFTTKCPVPLDKLIADINTDMVGRTLLNGEQKPAYMMMTPSTRNKDYNTLAARATELSEQYGFPNMENGDIYWTRSDHYNFAKHGIPTMFLCNGEHEDYHQPSDTPDKIDGDKIARSAKLAFHLGYEVAMSDVLPKVTGRVKKPKPESQPTQNPAK